MSGNVEELIAELNGCLGKTTSILSLVSNARASDITKSISMATIELVTGISSALQQSSAISESVKDQTRSTSDAIEAVKNLKSLVKMQKETIDSFNLHKASMQNTGINTDPVVVPEKKCVSCELLRKTVDSLESNLSSKNAQWKRTEEEWNAKRASNAREVTRYKEELEELGSRFAASEQKCKQLKMLIEKTNTVITVQQDKISSLEQWQQQKLQTLLQGRGNASSGSRGGYDDSASLRVESNGENRRNYEEPPPPPPVSLLASSGTVGKPPRSPGATGTLQELSSPKLTSDSIDMHQNATSDQNGDENEQEGASAGDDGPSRARVPLASSLPLSPGKGSRSPRSPLVRPQIHNIYSNARAPPLGLSRASVPSSSAGPGRYARDAADDTGGDHVEVEDDGEDADSTVFGMLEDDEQGDCGDFDGNGEEYGDGEGDGDGDGLDDRGRGVSAGSSPATSVGSHPWSLQEDEVSVDGSTGSGSFSMIQQYYDDHNLDEVDGSTVGSS